MSGCLLHGGSGLVVGGLIGWRINAGVSETPHPSAYKNKRDNRPCYKSRQAADEAILGALTHKAVIEQAKGILRGLLLVSAGQAFELLASQSQNTNTKLHAVAAAVIDAMDSGRATALLNAWTRTGPLQS